MRTLIGSKSYAALAALAMMATGAVHAQTTPPSPSVGTAAPGTIAEGTGVNAKPATVTPAPARPRVRRYNNFLPIAAPMLGLMGAGAAVAATAGGAATPASPQ